MTIQKTLLASLITLAAISGITHADSLAGALTELQTIQSGMSQQEINQKIQRFIERAPDGTNIKGVLADFGLTYTGPTVDTSPHQALITLPLDAPVIDRSSHLDSNVTQEQRDTAKAAAQELAAYHHNNPEGNPTHQTGPATHLDGTHQDTVTPHLDAPVIDRSSHLDSNVTQEQRDSAKAAAQELAAYHHNNPEGNPTHQTGPATHLDGTHQDTVPPHLDAPVIDRSSHLDSNVTQEQRDTAKAAAQELAAYHHNNPEGNPTHQTGPATHLDGTHQPLVTLHLDAPVIDRSSHLDSNVTQEQRDTAKAAAEELAAYHHNNPEGNPTHQTGPATHLDGTHQPLVTPHLDAPVIDRSSHLDSNVTQEQRDTAKAAAQELAAYHHNNPEGNPTHQTGPATHLDGTHQDTVTPHIDAPVIDRSSHLDSNVTQEQRDTAKAAAEELAAYHHYNPEGNPTHQTGPATHLDGTHQPLVTPHLDAPVIDRSSHLDSNVTQEQRDSAKAAAQELAAYHHNNPEGNPTHQTGPATHLDGTHQPLVTPHLDAPVIDLTSHLDSNVTDAERNAARYATYQHNNPEGNPTHQTGPAPHLDGIHQDTVTPHLDAPVIDRSAHLDSNVTDAERNAVRDAAYQHNNPEGNPTHQTAPAPHLDGEHNVAQTLTPTGPRQSEQRVLTAEKYADANAAPHNGIDGKNGVDGKDGQSITGKTGAKGKDADMTLVNANVVALRSVRNEQAVQGAYVQQNSANVALNRARIASNSAAINQNSHDIAANRKDIDENSKDIKRVGAMAQAVSSLHYNRNESGYAVAAGEYDSEASIAGGMQFRTSQDSAVTVQVSWDGNATGAGVGFHSNF